MIYIFDFEWNDTSLRHRSNYCNTVVFVIYAETCVKALDRNINKPINKPHQLYFGKSVTVHQLICFDGKWNDRLCLRFSFYDLWMKCVNAFDKDWIISTYTTHHICTTSPPTTKNTEILNFDKHFFCSYLKPEPTNP